MLRILLWIIAVVCAVWVIYDVLAMQKRMKTSEKVLWIVLALLLSIITAIIYYFVKKK
ncbi:MAG: PLDc N-terminal domain-containing protein [Candidatus Pacearchaeota archaeon]